MGQNWIIVTALLVLSGCGDSQARENANKSLKRAVQDVACANSHDDLKMAMGALASASQDYPKDQADEQAIQFADEFKSADCLPAAKQLANIAL